MTVSGFSIVRNGVKFDFPFLESIKSILPICDEFIIAVGKSDDNTREKIEELNNKKIKIIDTIWEENLRIGGKILAQQTDIALAHIKGDWGIYLQADEVIHERYLQTIFSDMEKYLDNRKIEGLLLNYLHFYGSYDYYADSRNWYRHEIRVIRNGIGVKSWKDAQGFRIGKRKMYVKQVEAYVYHYGWVKHPKVMLDKAIFFNKLWHDDDWVNNYFSGIDEFDFSKIDSLTKFNGTHPAVMKERIEKHNWNFSFHSKTKQNLKDCLLNFIEKKTNIRIGEYKNYRLIK